MTLTGRSDHAEASYLDIADAITRFGDPEMIKADLEQLYRRAAFNIAVANRDDHLRNHGFLGVPKGWRLSPSFDVNPSPNKSDHALAIDANDHSPSTDALRRVAREYRLRQSDADRVVADTRRQVSRWRDVAKRNGASDGKVES
jgi:serine/threonine-protein kinase HipA